jgi:hypothetical protein
MSIYDVIYGIPEDLSSLSMITYSICDNGIFLIRKAGCGSIVTKVDGIPGTGKGPEKNFNTILPKKIPFSVYSETVKFFRAVNKNFGDKSLEAFVLVLFNPKDETFKMYVPQHKITAGSVKYDLKDVWVDNQGYYLVLDIHSHHNMSAYFSGTDNNDDNRDRYSAVVGKIDSLIPDIAVRFSSLNSHWECKLEDVFENSDAILTLDIEEALSKIVISQPVAGASAWNGMRSSVVVNNIDRFGRSSYSRVFTGFKKLAYNGGNITDVAAHSRDFWGDFDEDEAEEA